MTDRRHRPDETVIIDPDLAGLVPKFLETRRTEIGLMLVALERGDYAAIQVIAHNMKGVGTSYGFEHVSKVGALLEQAAKDHDHEVVLAQIERLRDYLGRTLVV